MASRSDFESDYEWREWLGEVGDFDSRATECIRITYETEIKREIEVSFINLLCLTKSIYIYIQKFLQFYLPRPKKKTYFNRKLSRRHMSFKEIHCIRQVIEKETIYCLENGRIRTNNVLNLN